MVDIYNNGCCMTYNPDWVVREVKDVIRDIFVTGSERYRGGDGGGVGGMLGKLMKKS